MVNTDVNWKRNPRIAATKKKVCVISLPLLANVNVDKKVPEWFKLGVSDWNDSESEKENDNNFQPSKKRRVKLSAPKGKQCFAQVVYRRKSWRLFPIGTFREKHKVDGLNIYCSPPQFKHSVHFMLPLWYHQLCLDLIKSAQSTCKYSTCHRSKTFVESAP